jgi:hypothetical protein
MDNSREEDLKIYKETVGIESPSALSHRNGEATESIRHLGPQEFLSISHALKVRRIPVAFNDNLSGRTIQFLKIVRCQFDESRLDVFLQSAQSCSAWDGDDPRLLGKQPGESDLGLHVSAPRTPE